MGEGSGEKEETLTARLRASDKRSFSAIGQHGLECISFGLPFGWQTTAKEQDHDQGENDGTEQSRQLRRVVCVRIVDGGPGS